MNKVDIYIHGTPKGHEIWGSEKNEDYIKTFYNHDSAAAEEASMQIDICQGDAYYTYVRRQNVYNSEGRPGAFFAMTVCFAKAYCANVYVLYQIFDAVYKQICVGSLISQKHGKESYMVSDFRSASSNGKMTVEMMQAAFLSKVRELIEPYLQPLGNTGDTFNKVKMRYSLKEVDSPLFFDYFKRQSIIVSPNLEPAQTVNQAIKRQLADVNGQKGNLEIANARLKSENDALANENQSLSNQLRASESLSEKKHSASIDKLKEQLKSTEEELRSTRKDRDDLAAKIRAAKSSVEQIDKPVQKLTRLLAGRFPESNKAADGKTESGKQSSSNENSRKVRHEGFGNILLGIIIILCLAILYFVAFKPDLWHNRSNESQANNGAKTTAMEAVVATEPAEAYNVLIKYVVDGNTVKSRTPKVV